jgi:glucan 1,4-alpha-maltotetraohydrolase
MHTKKKLWLLSSLLFIGSTQALAGDEKASTGVRFAGGDEVMLQGFHWNVTRTATGNWYNILKSKAQELKDMGITAVWMPPPWKDESAWSDKEKGTWGGGEGYYWHNHDKNSRYGSDNDLYLAGQELFNKGLKVIYDMVPNHRNWSHPSAGSWYYPGSQYRNNGGECTFCDKFLSGDADLNTEHGDVYNYFKDEMRHLRRWKSAGGFRWDFVRGYPSGQVNAWMNDTFENSYTKDGQTMNYMDSFCVGELWLDNPQKSDLINWSNGSKCTVFDFALKKEINTGNVYNFRFGLNADSSAQNRERAVTFVDNHDTGYSPGPNGGQHHWPAPDYVRDAAYVWILLSPGTPSVYWADVFDWGRKDLIKHFIGIRKAAGIRAWSNITWHNDQSSQGICATVHGVNKMVKLAINTQPSCSPPSGWQEKGTGPWGKVWMEADPIVAQPDLGPGENKGSHRTRVFIKKVAGGGRIYLRGEGIGISNYPNMLDRADEKRGDSKLDWSAREAGQGSTAKGSPMVWTTKATGGATYVANGWNYHADAPDTNGDWWLFDAYLDCGSTGDGWIDVRAYWKKADGSEEWEPIAGNHGIRCGFHNQFVYGDTSAGAFVSFDIADY